MITVNIAALKNELSAYLRRVRAGEELLVRDRNLPVARLVPLSADETGLDERSLVASGQMTLPRRRFDAKRFWSIGGSAKRNDKVKRAIQRAIDADRQEEHVRLLGHKRHRAHLRSRPGK